MYVHYCMYVHYYLDECPSIFQFMLKNLSFEVNRKTPETLSRDKFSYSSGLKGPCVKVSRALDEARVVSLISFEATSSKSISLLFLFLLIAAYSLLGLNCTISWNWKIDQDTFQSQYSSNKFS